MISLIGQNNLRYLLVELDCLCEICLGNEFQLNIANKKQNIYMYSNQINCFKRTQQVILFMNSLHFAITLTCINLSIGLIKHELNLNKFN